MGNCSSKDGVRDDETAPLPQPTEPAAVASPKAATPTPLPNKPTPVLNTSVPLKDWSTHDIQVWLRTLPPHLVCYSPILMGPGIKVQEWNEQALTDLGVKTSPHRQDLLKQRQQLMVEISSALTAEQKPWQPPTDLASAAATSPTNLLAKSAKLNLSSEDLLSKRSPQGLTSNGTLPPSGALSSSHSLSPGPSHHSIFSGELPPPPDTSVPDSHRLLSPEREERLLSPGRDSRLLSSGREEREVQLASRIESVGSAGVTFGLPGTRDGRLEAEVDRNGLRRIGSGDVSAGGGCQANGERAGGMRERGPEVGRSPAREGHHGGSKTTTQRSGGLDSQRSGGLDDNLDLGVPGWRDGPRSGERDRGYGPRAGGHMPPQRSRERDNYESEGSGRWDNRHNGDYERRDSYREGGSDRRGMNGEAVSPRSVRDRPSPESKVPSTEYRNRMDCPDRLSPGPGDRRDLLSPERRDRLPTERRDRLSPEPRSRQDPLSPEPRSRQNRLSPESRSRQDRLSPEPRSRQDRLSPEPRSRQDRLSPGPRVAPDRISPRPQRRSPPTRPDHMDRLSPGPRERGMDREIDQVMDQGFDRGLDRGLDHGVDHFRDPFDRAMERSSSLERPDRHSPESRSYRPLPDRHSPESRSYGHPPDRRPSPLREQPRFSPPVRDPTPSLNRITEPAPLHRSPSPEPFRNSLSAAWPLEDAPALRGPVAGAALGTGGNGGGGAVPNRSPGRPRGFEVSSSVEFGLPVADRAGYDKGRSVSYGDQLAVSGELNVGGPRRAGSVPLGVNGREWNEGLDNSLERPFFSHDSDLVVASSTERPLPTPQTLNGLGFMRSDPPNLADLSASSANLVQMLSSSSVRGQAVRLLSMVENSRQRWDEESRHVDALLRHAAEALPHPGPQLCSRLRSMYSHLDMLMLNQIHYRKMFERALAVMALMCEVLAAAPFTRARWRSFASRLDDVLMAVEEYMTPVSGKSWLGVLVTGGWSSDLMLAWWRKLADLAAELVADASSSSPPVEECLARFNMSCKFDDESSKMKNLISALGGIAVVMGEPKKTLELCAMLNTRKRHQKLTVNQVLQAALLMECTVEAGPHCIITNDAMRMLWYRCFPNRHSVSWPEFWKVFPAVLPDLGMDITEVDSLNNLFKDIQRRQNLQLRVSNGNATGVSAFNIREAFPKYVSLQEACVLASDETHSSPDSLIDHSPPAGLFGREDGLPVLLTSLSEVWRPSIVLLQGDVGRGKSALVHEVATRLRLVNFPPGGIFQVEMHKATTGNELAARVCAALGAVLDNDDKTAMWVALQRLSSLGSLLLVMEDISAAATSHDGKMALTNLLQQILTKAPNTRVLLTSSVPAELPGLQLERHILGQLSPEGALALLQSSMPEMDKEVGLRLANICQFQPLSLNLAAACLAHGHCSTQDIANLHREHATPDAADHPEAGVLPAVLSVLPQPLVEALTHLVIFPQHFDDRAAALVLRRDVPDTRGLLAGLCARNLIKPNKSTGTYRMHPAIRELATKQLCPSGFPHPAISGFLVSCLEMLRTAGSMYRQCHCSVALQWVNQQRHNLLGLLNLLNSGVLSETLVNQVEDLAQGMEVMTALEIGNPRAFAKMWYILSIGVERVLTPTHPNLATVLSCRADVLAKMQHHVEAEKLYKQAMHIISKVPGGAQPQFATVLEKLGVLLSKQGSFEHATHHLRRALNIKQRILGDDSMEVAEARIKLASVLSQKDADSEEAEQLLTDGYATMVADVAQGNHHPRVIEPFTNLAASYMAQDLHSEAERMYRCVLQVQEDLLEQRDPRLVGTLRKLAAACASQNKLDEAEALYKQALQIQQHYYGQGQLESVPVMNKLAAIYSQQGKYDEAEAIFNNALSIQRQHQGENHADLAPTLCELGDLLCKQSKWAKAELAYKEALQVLKAVSAEEKIFARVLVRLATAVEAQERPKEAQALYEQLVALQRKVVGENSHQVADAYQKMGGVLQQQGESVQAQAMTEKSVAILQQLIGDTPRLAEALKVLGMQMSANGLHEEAEQKLRHAITIETQAYGPNNLRLTDGLLRLAEVMQKLGKLNDAEEATSWVIDINLQGATPSECNNPGIAKLYINLAGIQQSQGKLADAVLSLQRALAIYDRLVARLVAQPAAWRTDELVIKIADLLSENGQYGQAEGYYARAVSEQEATQGNGSLDLATSIFKLALAQSAQSKHSEAEQLYQRALNIRQNALGSGHPDLLPVLSGLAMARGAQGDLPTAERLYFQALEILESHDGMNHPDAANVIDHLHETLESQGNIKELGCLYMRVRNLKPTTGPSQDVVTNLLKNSQKYNLDEALDRDME